MDICIVIDRRLRPELASGGLLEQAAGSGADLIQIREKDLSDSELLRWTQEAVALCAAHGPAPRVMVNGRPDVALAAGAAGVHLPADGLPVADVVARWHGELQVGVSTHSVAEVLQAQDDGADYAMLGPIFDTPSKRSFGAPLGAAVLEEACRRTAIPILAIGGINSATADRLRGLPIGGVAVISAVLGAPDMRAAVSALRGALMAPAGAASGRSRIGVEEVCR